LPEFSPLKPQMDQASRKSETDKKNCCDLCGIPVGRSRAKQVVGGKVLYFCCPGCQYVFQALFNSPDGMPADFRMTDLYRSCVESGIIPRSEEDLTSSQAQKDFDDPCRLTIQSQLDKEQARELILKVKGMWCPACSWLTPCSSAARGARPRAIPKGSR